MDNKKITFIICANDGQYYDECLRYIDELEVPEGYETDILCIQETSNMAAGYQAGMQASQAKYKIYLRQETFILNARFLYDMLEIFTQDEQVGMIGVAGMTELPPKGKHSKVRSVGSLLFYNMASEPICEPEQVPEGVCLSVQAVHGILLATQYDITWQEDAAEGAHFYSISHSMEMQKSGYKVVVPYQSSSWCYFDGGFWETQDFNLEENINVQTTEQLWLMFVKIFDAGLYDELLNAMTLLPSGVRFQDNRIYEMVHMMEVYSLERASKQGVVSPWFQIPSWEEAYAYYREVRFILIRIASQKKDERAQMLKDMVKEGTLSRDAVYKIAVQSVRDISLIGQYILSEKREEPLVSVLLPVYNGAKTIGATLDSVLSQTYQNMEIIIVDDASTDKSKDVISLYKDKRIQLISLPKNRNVCYAGNVGFQKAAGKYVALMGHDDIWKKDKIEKQVAFLEEHPSYGLCFSWTELIDENEKVVNDLHQELYRRFCSKNLCNEKWSRKLFFYMNHFCAPSACIRREVLEKTGYYRYSLIQLQDYDLWLRVLKECAVYIFEEKLTLYRRFSNDSNLSSFSWPAVHRDRHEKQWIQKDYIKNLSPEDFVSIFGEDMIDSSAVGEQEIICEKMFLLRKVENMFALDWTIELLEQREYRELLENKYHFTLHEFYKVNGTPMHYEEQ